MIKKRYINIIGINGGIEDTSTGEIIKGSRIGDLLNELHNENEHLKKVLFDLAKDNECTVEDLILWSDGLND